MRTADYIRATSIAEAADALKNENALLSAGGTDLIGVIKDKLLPTQPDTVVSIKAIPALDTIREEADGIHIGAAATLRAISDSALLRAKAPALCEAAYSVATPNIRNTATIGGNICQDIRCWYYRYPNNLGGRIDCARKEGNLCYAMMGENRYHSIFGAAKVCETACTGECPAKTDISAYMELVRAGKMDEAAQILLEVNPMPAITSRVCAHFCMEGCSRNRYDEALNIGSVERYLGDMILDNPEKYMHGATKENGKSVAIIGSGPAGLTTAYYLRQAGYAVTMYEKQPEAGGCLMYAIPAFRLPKDIVRKFVSLLTGYGIKIQCNTTVGQDITLDDIVKANDSVMLDTGTWKRPLIGLSGEELTRFGLDFLVAVNTYMSEKPGSNVVVVGGGNVAMDVAITAKRLGAKSVRMLCLEDRDNMPANQEEIERALEEDIEILNGWGPRQVIRNEHGVCGMEFKRCTRSHDEQGRFSPLYDEEDLKTLDADVVFMAIGQKADLDFLEGAFSVEVERGRIMAREDQMTSVPGIFVAGDAATGPSTVVMAIAAGKATAVSINRYLQGEKLPVEDVCDAREQRDVLTFDAACKSCKAAIKQSMLPTDQRAMDKEDMAGVSTSEAQAEAGRCFNCGCLAVNSSDVANMLLVYDATIKTNQRTLSAAELLASKTRVKDVLLPDEIVTGVVVPVLPEGTVQAYNKYRQRKSIDFAIVAVASAYTVKEGTIADARIVLGACAPVPMRATAAERYLVGKKPTQDVARQAADLALQDAFALDKNAYKIDLAKTMVARSLDI
ncbi:FAD-dependent oxidoreductase [Eubacteriales bacterium OttesenSCG-928-A19]|nr:FAD-dependent oxidoreductase [Eubacteriales bacterium OttesenSCG-928-A19]